ncbi:MAG: glycosyltransferase family 39 protein [Deltaproteobacteria bacterium]|nr:glycosyltransferase family 39 protein [Deltaproteobacteria bacterium]
MSTTLVLFGILFVLVRLAVLVHPDGAGWAAQRDEALTGNVALGLESGFGFAPPLYQTKPFAAGTLYEGLLSVPFRKIFGPNLFALKLAAVAWNVAAMLLWIALAWRYFGRAAALAVGTLHVLAPPFYALMTVTAWGNHCESSLFAAAMLLFLLPAVMFRGPGRGVLFAALAGLGAGVGVYMSYTSLLYVAFGLVVIFLCAGKRGAARILPAFAAAGVIGALPLLWSVRHYGLSALLKIDTYTGYAQGAMVSSRTLFLESGFGLALKNSCSSGRATSGTPRSC